MADQGGQDQLDQQNQQHDQQDQQHIPQQQVLQLQQAPPAAPPPALGFTPEQLLQLQQLIAAAIPAPPPPPPPPAAAQQPPGGVPPPPPPPPPVGQQQLGGAAPQAPVNGRQPAPPPHAAARHQHAPPDFSGPLAAPNEQTLVIRALALLRPTMGCLRPPLLAAVAACGGAACTTSLGLKAQIDKHIEEWRSSCPEYFEYFVALREDLLGAAAPPPCPIRSALELAHLSLLARRLARPILFGLLELRTRAPAKDDHLDALLRGVGEDALVPKRQR